jgi:hypothetical protein
MMGANTTVAGLQSIAIGIGAATSAADAVAIGTGAQAGFANSAAFGVNAAATKANEQMFGTATSLYTMPGVTTPASVTAQSGPIVFVTSDAAGHLASAAIPAGLCIEPAGGNFQCGTGAVANGGNTTAVGQNAQASGASSTAYGFNASASHANSAAFGNGASTARANQQVFGTAANTYTAPGLASGASRTAQGAPTHIVTSNAGGDLASYTPSELGLATQAGLNAVNTRVDKANAGVAMAFAMAGTPNLMPNEKFAVSMNWGAFERQHGVALASALRLSDTVQVNSGVGYGVNGNTFGGRAGLRIGW